MKSDAVTGFSESPRGPIRVGLVEDDEFIREVLEATIAQADDLTMVMSVGTRRAALRQMGTRKPDVMVVDLGLPDGSGLDVIAMAQRVLPACAVMVFTMFSDHTHVLKAIQAGATGYLLKNMAPEHMAEQIRSLHAGGSPINPMVARKILQQVTDMADATDEFEPASAPSLSPRQIEVLRLIGRGLTAKETAGALAMSEHTVLTYVRRIYKKLGIASRAQAAEAASRMGLFHRA